jgi:septal ring factor EnvC (AmiA/AmiB activator)
MLLDLEVENKTKNAVLEEFVSKLTARGAKKAMLKKLLGEKDSELNMLCTKVKSKQRSKAGLKSQVSSKDKELQSLRAKLKSHPGAQDILAE